MRSIKKAARHYHIDLDPTHSVIRLTVTAETMTPELAEEVHIRLSWLARSGGPFAGIVDLSGVTSWRLSADEVRDFALRDPAVQGEEPTSLWPKSHRYSE